jgi:hypothetical protein
MDNDSADLALVASDPTPADIVSASPRPYTHRFS